MQFDENDTLELVVHTELTCNCFTIPISEHTFKVGTKAIFSAKNEFIYVDDIPVCYYNSETGLKYFCRNDDGMGLLRHKYTYAIAQSDRIRIHDDGIVSRFTPEEIDEIYKNWSHFLADAPDVLLFNSNFYNATIDDLRKMARAVNIRVNEDLNTNNNNKNEINVEEIKVVDNVHIT